MPLIELSGSPMDRGLSYGEMMRQEIAEIIFAWRDNLKRSLGNRSEPYGSVDHYIGDFLSRNFFSEAIQQWVPDMYEEIKGLAKGSFQTEQNIFCMQLMDEEWNFGRRLNIDKPTSKCTAFGILKQTNGISYAGQNMDIPLWMEGGQVLLSVKGQDANPDAFIFSVAGQMGLNGVNSRGVGITCNTLAELSGFSDGLPVTLIVRKVLEAPNINSAEAFLRSVKHASGQCYILSSSNEIRCFECSGVFVKRYYSTQFSDRIFHTNHVLNKKSFIIDSPLEYRSKKNTIVRLETISRRLGNSSKLHDLYDIQSALSSHDDPNNPVSRHSLDDQSPIGYTAGSSIYEFGECVKLHLASGPPCKTEYRTFEFDRCLTD